MNRLTALAPKKLKITAGQLRQFWEEDESYFVTCAQKNNAHQILRESIVAQAVNMMVAVHLQLCTDLPVAPEVNKGADRAIDYFYGNWWQADPNDRRNLDKSLPSSERSIIWTAPYLYGVLLCALADRWNDVIHLSDWIDESIMPEFRFELNSDALSVFYIYLPSKLRSKPLLRELEMAEFIRNSRSKSAKLLLDVLNCSLSKSQRDFDNALIRSLKHAEKHEVEDVASLKYWVAIPQSAIWLIAERNGLSFPVVPPNLDALVLRRETVFTLS